MEIYGKRMRISDELRELREKEKREVCKMDNMQYLLHFLTGPQDFKSLLHVYERRIRRASINERV